MKRSDLLKGKKDTVAGTIEKILAKDSRFIASEKLRLEGLLADTEEAIEEWLTTPDLTINIEFMNVWKLKKIYEGSLKDLEEIKEIIQ